MKVLKVKLYQELVNYRKSYSYNFLESYPLPTFSIIKGWMYNSINAKDKDTYYNETIHDLKIAVSGKLEGLTYDLQHMIKIGDMGDFDKIKKSLQTRTPTYVTLISSIELNVYISANNRLLNDFCNNIFRNYPSLGRYEDLACVLSCGFYDLSDVTFDPFNNHSVNYYTYVSEVTAKGNSCLRGAHLRVPTVYEIKNGIRYFRKSNVICISDGCSISEGNFLYDKEDNRIVDFISLGI